MWDQLASEYILYIWFTKGLQNLNSKRKQKEQKVKIRKKKHIFPNKNRIRMDIKLFN